MPKSDEKLYTIKAKSGAEIVVHSGVNGDTYLEMVNPNGEGFCMTLTDTQLFELAYVFKRVPSLREIL